MAFSASKVGENVFGSLRVTYGTFTGGSTTGGNINTGLLYDKKRYYNASENISGAPLQDVNATNAQPGQIVQIGDKNLSVGTWTLNGDHYDSLWGGGAFYWGSNLTYGNLDLTSSPAIAVLTDQNGLNAAGKYTKYTGNLSRLQRLTDTTTLWMSWQGQLASKNLDSSEDFSLGGPQGVRAYPNYEAQGDQGWLGTLEGRRMFGEKWQGSAFFDAGRIKVNRFTWTNSYSPNMYNLYGAGLGMSYSLPGLMTGKAMVAHRIGSNPGANPTNGSDNDGTHLPWRFWLSLSGTF